MNEIITINTTQRMTSREIAELMEKRHDHVMRDIKKLIVEDIIGLPRFGETSYFDEWNRKQPMYELDFHATMVLITGYDAKRRAMVIDRWIKLETGQATPAMDAMDISTAIMADNYEFTRKQLREARSENKLLQAKLLGVMPYWAKIKQCKDMELTNAETSRVIGKSQRFVSSTLKKMADLGIKPERVSFRILLLESDLRIARRESENLKRLFPEQYEQVKQRRLDQEGGAA